jgi:hypothetical protein
VPLSLLVDRPVFGAIAEMKIKKNQRSFTGNAMSITYV